MKMKRLLRVVFAVSLLVCGLCGSVYAQPKIKFYEKVYDFGKVYSGEVVKNVFRFKNVGSEPLKILDVSTSCGCTGVLKSSKKVPPGEEGEIQVVFNTRGYSGNVTKLVYVRSNDPKNPTAKLRIQGYIRLDLLIYPRYFFVYMREKDKPARRILTLTNKGREPVRIRYVRAEDPDIVNVLNFKPARLKPHQSMRLDVMFRFTSPSGDRMKSKILIGTDHPKHLKVEIPVRLQLYKKGLTGAKRKMFYEKLKEYIEIQRRLREERKSARGSEKFPR